MSEKTRAEKIRAILLEQDKKFWDTTAGSAIIALAALAAIAAIIWSLYSTFSVPVTKPTTDKSSASTSVMITSPDQHAGGTGVIYRSTTTKSYVLTNKHVCGVVENGGLVITDDGQEHAVVGYLKSKDHDLCMISVAADLHVNTEIASRAPEYYSKAAISGHPALLPTVVTHGHFSGRKIISVVTGIKKCTDEDLKANPLMCVFVGGIPQLKSYEAQLVTATIQGGSSGSAVFNEDGEIAGLVFAGSGTIGYAFIVPYESVYNFVTNEWPMSEAIKPNTEFQLGAPAAAPESTSSSELLNARCLTYTSTSNEDKVGNVCNAVNKDMIYYGKGVK